MSRSPCGYSATSWFFFFSRAHRALHFDDCVQQQMPRQQQRSVIGARQTTTLEQQFGGTCSCVLIECRSDKVSSSAHCGPRAVCKVSLCIFLKTRSQHQCSQRLHSTKVTLQRQPQSSQRDVWSAGVAPCLAQRLSKNAKRRSYADQYAAAGTTSRRLAHRQSPPHTCKLSCQPTQSAAQEDSVRSSHPVVFAL